MLATMLDAMMGNGRTFRPQKHHRLGSKRHELHLMARKTLGTVSLRDAVKLPAGESRQEWLALKTIDVFNDTNVMYSIISEYCSEQSCPCMSAGSRYEYMWADRASAEFRRPKVVPAKRYVELLMQWVERQVDDAAIFPTAAGVPFPPEFEEVVRNIFRRLFRVYAHVYYSHMDRVQMAGAEPHLNTAFKHFVYTALEFDLIPANERLPLQQKIELLQQDDEKRFGHASTVAPVDESDRDRRVEAGEHSPIAPVRAIAAAR